MRRGTLKSASRAATNSRNSTSSAGLPAAELPAAVLFGAQNHGSGNVFAKAVVGKRKRHRLRYRRMFHQGFVHFRGRNLFTTAIDDFFDAAGKKQVPVGVDSAFIARPKPSIRGKCDLVGVGIVFVTGR